MLKKLSIGLLFVTSVGFASEGDQRSGANDNPLYKQLSWDYVEVANSNMSQREKSEKVMEITDKMRNLAHVENKDYNRCMKESNQQQRSDYARCDKRGGSDKCYDRADRNAKSRSSGCERVAHSDNVRDTVNKD